MKNLFGMFLCGAILSLQTVLAGSFRVGTFMSPADLGLDKGEGIVQAIRIGGPKTSAGSGTLKVGEVTFAPDTTGIFASIPSVIDGMTGDWPEGSVALTPDENLNALLRHFYYSVQESMQMQYTVTGLVPGKTYRTQLIFYDASTQKPFNPTSSGSATIVEGDDTLNDFNYVSATLNAGGWSRHLGVFANYDFTADKDTLKIGISLPHGRVVLSAFLVREISPAKK